MNGIGLCEMTRDGGHMQMKGILSIHWVPETHVVRQFKMDGMKDISDGTREETEPHSHDHKVKILPNWVFLTVDEPSRYERDKKPITSTSKSAPGKRILVERKPLTKEPPPPSITVQTPPKSKAITASLLLGEDDPPLSKLMGFSRFSTTKGKKHEDYGAVDKITKRTYRQYMNRPGGFNRPLD
jgi:U4/U6.U5 small nuclear ribonucleoproteins